MRHDVFCSWVKKQDTTSSDSGFGSRFNRLREVHSASEHDARWIPDLLTRHLLIV